MATTPPPDFTPEPPAPEPQPDPWAPLAQRGFDPTRYDPDAIVNGANLYTALRSRDYQEGAIADVLRHAGFPDGLSVRELRELAQAQQQPDPWADLVPQQPEPEYYAEPQQSPTPDPRMFQSAIEQEIERRFALRDQQAEEARQQQAYEAEFMREADRVAKEYDFGQQETRWLAVEANDLRQAMPYATTDQVMDAAGKRIDERDRKRLQALSQRQESAPAAPLPGGAIPSDQQVPQSAEEAREAGRRFFTG